MRRGLALARDYASRRTAFGKVLSEHPLHVETLADLEIEFQAAFHLAFHAVTLMGATECGEATDEEITALRLLTPLVKLHTAKQAVAAASETLELFGGAGYVEDTGLPQLLRDAQVLPIWEGTTNILSLDCLRAIDKEQALGPFLAHFERRLESVRHASLLAGKERVLHTLSAAKDYLLQAVGRGQESVETGARQFAFTLARSAAGALMLEHAQWSLDHDNDRRDAIAAQRWCSRRLATVVEADADYIAESHALGLDLHVEDHDVESRQQVSLNS